jgi:hypothetical protein
MVCLGSLLGLPAEDWSAIAAWFTAGVAVVAAFVALRQVLEARRLRAEQAQPYVVAYLEESGVARFVDLVIKNLGTTAATTVTLQMRPAPERAIASGETKFSPLVPAEIPVLVPNQEWRTLFDTTMARAESDLPRRYEVQVAFRDSRKRKGFAFDYVLDWDLMINRASATEYGIHDIAKAARDLSREVRRWKEGAGANGLRVYVRDGDARDRRRAASRRDGASRAVTARATRYLRRLVGLPAISPDGLVADVWWGEEGRRRNRRRERVARYRMGRAMQRLLS